jgi:hypothetical protein
MYTDNIGLSRAITLSSSHQQSSAFQISFSRVMDAIKSDVLHEEALQISESFARRRPSWRQQGRDTTFACQELKKWAFSAKSSVLIAKAGPRAEARANGMVVETTRYLKSLNVPVFWHLAPTGHRNTESSPATVLKNVIFQAIQHDPSIISQDPRLCNIETDEAKYRPGEWTNLAVLILSKFKPCYVIIETENVNRSAKHGDAEILQMMSTFSQVSKEVEEAGGAMKLLLVSYRSRGRLSMGYTEPSQTVVSLNPALPAVRRANQSLTPVFLTNRPQRELLAAKCRPRV